MRSHVASPFVVTEEENYDAVIAFAEKYLSQSEVALMKLGLSLRIYSARVEMFTQMAENKDISVFDCYNVVNVGGVFTCSLQELEQLASQVRDMYVCACQLISIICIAFI